MSKEDNVVPNRDQLEQYATIMEWMYVNDGAFDSKQEWREAFNEMLREVVLGEEVEDCEHSVTISTR